ncbi:hypothetical protein JTE90_004201 [Oedothorax gibbosus]|uniref:1-acylglycerol-3-phosphate O-acyltransferase ABHD5 n=1 Tax=Oedothorax gibbosus TaxID=931172 RepID=A0AAV6V3T6_9ARAC|nr:hypothetical protein JTE90_004201 [Oedothorax gibbosus]
MSDIKIPEKAMDLQSRGNWISDWFRWCPTSTALLEDAERRMLSYVESDCDLSFVPINSSADGECKVRSMIVNKNLEDKATPLVLLHGFGSGIGLWVLNIDSLSKDRPLYALDILGFGLSSRPTFSNDAEVAENQIIDSIEEWRKKVGLKQFILLGHSMGGFLAASYAIKFPERVKHLFLADPWGFPIREGNEKPRIHIPLWARTLVLLLKPFNPLAYLRAVGPWGPQLIQRMRPDILRKFETVVTDTSDVSNYIYHCNAQHPSGEAAFKAMTIQFGWANRPMIQRIAQLRQDIPISFIFGAQSWIDSSSGDKTTALRENSYVKIEMIDGAGHHVYADRAEVFNNLVCQICRKVDNNELSVTSPTSSKGSNMLSLNATKIEDTCLPEPV